MTKTPYRPETGQSTSPDDRTVRSDISEMLEESGLLVVPPLSTFSNRFHIPRHISVPFLAGVLVAVLGLLMVRFVVTGHRHNPAEEVTVGYAGSAWADETQQTGGQPGHGAVDIRTHISPTTELLDWNEIALHNDTGGIVTRDVTGCTLLGNNPSSHRLAASFGKPRRLSHLTIHACPESFRGKSPLRLLISMEDGTHREVELRTDAAPINVDLAGAWSSLVTIESLDGAVAGLKVDQLQFYALSE